MKNEIQEHSVPIPRICPECGCDRYLEGEFEKIQRRATRIEKTALNEARRHGQERMKLLIEVETLKASRESLQRKVAKQRYALNKLEAKLREIR